MVKQIYTIGQITENCSHTKESNTCHCLIIAYLLGDETTLAHAGEKNGAFAVIKLSKRTTTPHTHPLEVTHWNKQTYIHMLFSPKFLFADQGSLTSHSTPPRF
jgi:hypothetical protein